MEAARHCLSQSDGAAQAFGRLVHHPQFIGDTCREGACQERHPRLGRDGSQGPPSPAWLSGLSGEQSTSPTTLLCTRGAGLFIKSVGSCS